MTPQELFVTRLRRHRERTGLSLDDIARDTRIKRELLEAFERNDLSDWPRGLYARAWVRAYVSAIGHDPVEALEEFCRLFPHGDRRAAATMSEIAAIVASPSAYRDEFTHVASQDRRRAPDTAHTVVVPKQTLLGQLARGIRAVQALIVQVPFLHRAQYRERQ